MKFGMLNFYAVLDYVIDGFRELKGTYYFSIKIKMIKCSQTSAHMTW